MTEYTWEWGDVPYTKGLEKFHRELLSEQNSNKIQKIADEIIQKFSYSEIIQKRIQEKFKKFNGSDDKVDIYLSDELISLWQWPGYEDQAINFRTFNDFLEWLDND